MSKKPTPISSMEITYHLGATITVDGGESWVKPGVSASVRFDGMPTPQEIRTASDYLAREVVEPMINEVVTEAAEQAVKARQNLL